ncbi:MULTISPECIES: hypothetical protein [unclassified Gilliamella]|uniref:hypothetical protein n=1 Tax=unclassified Gilliamella TaxID=2685620 RepID=UPI00226A1AC3|nr:MULTISPECIES: hypothetical protein [unclassified Gilliamella]MCX8596372.1 hypothetical protein [Gilliamella sp. B3493]MCX8599170.1 hypothetical protein [Gilliamella sp. B3486]MCX8689456.1 hypothetical protein [Gilliamella sp. B2973]MCX8705157.1 hypothetical protein [Gilliamella sp. B3127]
MFKRLLAISIVSFVLIGCGDNKTSLTGKACLGDNNDTLIETLGSGQCSAGDTIGTKYPAYYCDFSYAIAYNNYNSAICVYTGKMAQERIAK